MSTPSLKSEPIIIKIDSSGMPERADVQKGDKVLWEAPPNSAVFIVPPAIFVGPECQSEGEIFLGPGQIGPDGPCRVGGKPGTYHYTCGLFPKKVPPILRDGGEIIIVTTDADKHKYSH